MYNMYSIYSIYSTVDIGKIDHVYISINPKYKQIHEYIDKEINKIK